MTCYDDDSVTVSLGYYLALGSIVLNKPIDPVLSRPRLPASLGQWTVPFLGSSMPFLSSQPRLFSTSCRQSTDNPKEPKLTHVNESGSAHMVSISEKNPTSRVAKAVCTVKFTNQTAPALIQANKMKKGDVLGVARIAGIMAAKKTSDLIPLCHPIPISHVGVEVEVDGDEAHVEATVSCDGKTGVEMEALTAASTAALTVYDMCKAVDKGMRIEGLRVVLKDGGRSGRWESL